MTPEERIAALETKLEGQQKWLESIDKKQDEILAAMNMGKGAWAALLKIGAALAAVTAMFSWLSDKLHWLK